MKDKYIVEVKETFQRRYLVTAGDGFEARDMIEEAYKREEIVLGSEDYTETEFEVLENDTDSTDGITPWEPSAEAEEVSL